MIFIKDSVCMIEGHEPLVLAETTILLTSVYVNLKKGHGEEMANELFARLGKRAIEAVDTFEENAIDVNNVGR